jgi:hypothetical protein
MAAVDVAPKAHVATQAMVDKAAVDAVANTLHAPRAHEVPKAMAAAVKAVDAHPWVMHNPAAMKADLAAAWASVLPVARRAANPIPCAPVSI